MPIHIFFSLIASGLILGLAAWVFVRNPKSPINLWYALTMATTGFWGFIESFLLLGRTVEWVMIWGVISYACVPVIPFCFLQFTYCFPHQTKPFSAPSRTVALLLLLLSTVIAATPGGVVKSPILRPTYGDLVLNTFGWAVWAIIFFTLFVWGYYNLFQKLRRSSGFLKQQLTHVIILTIIPVIIATIFSALAPIFYGESYGWVGVLSLIVPALGGFYYLTLFSKKIYIDRRPP